MSSLLESRDKLGMDLPMTPCPGADEYKEKKWAYRSQPKMVLPFSRLERTNVANVAQNRKCDVILNKIIDMHCNKTDPCLPLGMTLGMYLTLSLGLSLCLSVCLFVCLLVYLLLYFLKYHLVCLSVCFLVLWFISWFVSQFVSWFVVRFVSWIVSGTASTTSRFVSQSTYQLLLNRLLVCPLIWSPSL